MVIFTLLLLSACGNTSNKTSSNGKDNEQNNGGNTYTVEHEEDATDVTYMMLGRNWESKRYEIL